ncbi:hypothetical protein SAMN05216428_102373 [Nitrosospira sp. Nsp11]|uniref:DUF6682 family protein n=1 Tax=Nitrosospira sp. Nsp11 TaxID=1855338 RepID=UPI000923D323|nr:DUF6682 family protein [Nitrosospira sp. Nsp11]SHL42766.1 hypothetical protein SAMN05216428_102373 [Nitrosospira sp. Nsp11]
MAFTYQSVVDLARIPLNDADGARYTDETLLAFVNHGLLVVVKRRPDLFVGNFSNLPTGEKTLTDAFPLPAEYIQLIADYVTFRAESADDEHVNSGRAAAFANLFGAEAPA